MQLQPTHCYWCSFCCGCLLLLLHLYADTPDSLHAKPHPLSGHKQSMIVLNDGIQPHTHGCICTQSALSMPESSGGTHVWHMPALAGLFGDDACPQAFMTVAECFIVASTSIITWVAACYEGFMTEAPVCDVVCDVSP